jgi:hypothetical protein
MADKFIGEALYTKTHVAGEALVANRFVKLVSPSSPYTQPTVVYADAGDAAAGVSRDAYRSGDPADVVKLGAWYVEAGDNITAGTAVAAANDGKAVPAASTNQVLGQAQTDANTGDFCLVLLAFGGIF